MISSTQKLFKIFSTCLKYSTSFIVSLILTPLTVITMAIFTIYRLLVSTILKIWYGKRFSGLVRGADVVHTMEEPSKAIINSLIVVHCNHDNPQVFYENTIVFLKKFWFENPNSFPKFKLIFLKAFGYSYMLKDEITPEECLRKMKIVGSQERELNKTELLELIADCCNLPLPRNEKVLWEILVGTQRMKWNPEDTKTYFPVLFRVHHGVADGVSLLKLLIGVFADSPSIEIVSSNDYKKITISTNVTVENKSLNRFCIETLMVFLKHANYMMHQIATVLHILILYPAVWFTQLVLKCNDSNILHGPPLTGQKILALTVEDKDEYVKKIKLIKTRITGISFSDILLTAISASLRDYFAKKSEKFPKHISSLVPVLPGSLNLQYMIPGQLNENSIKFKNGYSFILPILPLFIPFNKAEMKTPLLSRLRLINRDMSVLKYSIDYMVNYFIMSVIGGVLPQPIIRLILKGSHCTTLISILAGPQGMSFGGGTYLMQNLAFWVPHVKNVGVSFSVLTYRNRLHVGLSVDKALIAQQSDAQNIVDGVFKYLDDIENELNSTEDIEKN